MGAALRIHNSLHALSLTILPLHALLPDKPAQNHMAILVAWIQRLADSMPQERPAATTAEHKVSNPRRCTYPPDTVGRMPLTMNGGQLHDPKLSRRNRSGLTRLLSCREDPSIDTSSPSRIG